MSEKLRMARKAGKENHIEQQKNTPKTHSQLGPIFERVRKTQSRLCISEVW